MWRRNILIVLSVAILGGLSFASTQVPRQSWQSDISTLRPDDRPVPIPWSAKLPFPWTIAQGVWLAQKGDFKSYYSFRVINQQGSTNRQIYVQQIDAVTCDVIAAGVGLSTDRTLYAQMRNQVDGRVYSLGLSGFEESVLPDELVSKPINGKAMIISISVVNETRQTHYLGIEKLTEKFNFNCKERSENEYGY